MYFIKYKINKNIMKGAIDPITIILIIAVIIFLLFIVGIIKPSDIINFLKGASP
jgi:uncharacterized membrane protein YvbJ